MAKGEYILFNEVPFRSVTSHPRRYGVMFSPSSSRSRFRVIDAGRRYAVRLRNGVVEYSIDGDVTWQPINSFADPCTGQKLPKIVSHQNLRVGEELTDLTFDMVAAGRGRIIAKEAGTDRLFHLYMDEMFRTHQRNCNPGEPGTALDEDPPVPPFNMKLDPEYFTPDPPSLIVPPESTRDYSKHPGSLRLPIFNLLLELDVADVMLVMERARTWYLKDTRSQLAIMGPEDFNFSEDDFKTVFTVKVLRDILESLKSALMAWSKNPLIDFLIWTLDQPHEMAADWRRSIEEKGYAVLVFPAYVALGALLYGANFVKAVRPEVGGRVRIDLPALRNLFASQTDNSDAQGFIDDVAAKLFEAIAQLRLLSRRGALEQYGARPDVNRVELPPEWTIENRMPTPNQPPAWMPTYVRTRYVRSKGTWRGVWKKFYGKNDKLASVWLGTNADGRLEAFGIADNNTIWHTSQLAPNGSWNGAWAAFHSEADKLSKLAIARNSDGRLEVFGVSPDDRVWHTWQETPNGDWNGGWGELYSSADRLKTIAAARNQDGRLEAFGVGPDRRIWHTWQTKPGADWVGKWEELYSSADKLRDLWVTSNADGRLEVFGISPDDNRVWHTWQDVAGDKWNGSWTELYSKADKLSSLAVGRNQDGRLEVFGVGPDQRIWHTWQQSPGGNWIDSWNPFYTAGDKLSDLWVVSNTDGRLEVFGVLAGFPNLNDRVWHTWQTSPNGNWNGAWMEIEAQFGRRTLAVAPNADGEIEIVGITGHPFPDNKIWNTRLLSDKRYAIEFSRVLDIGIGSCHWSEQWLTHYGGEIHALPARRPIAQQERYSSTQYRFLNGPVIDGDAYNDGTTNFYMLVKLGAPGSDGAGLRQRYAILWFDEQTYFTQRWRLAHPTDDILGDLFSLPHYLRTNPDWYNFSLATFWSPFTSDLINDDSRMAIQRNIITLTGFNQAAQRHEIYTICFNYGMCDHTWRWRLFPAAEQVLINSAVAQDADPQLPDVTKNGPANAYVVVNTLNLRDDTTLHVRGSKRSSTGAPLRAGRWVQRYLPADCKHVPPKHQLTAGKPASGFSHAWDFVSDTAYRRADLFYQFGVYENRLDSRCQYYKVELLPGANGELPRVEDVVGRVWGNDKNSAGEARLRINTINFTWGLHRVVEEGKEFIVKRLTPVAGEETSDETFAHEYRKRPSMSLYEPTARFRILERKPLGLIAVFFDKRDDDLQSASDLPQPTIFRKDSAEANIPKTWRDEDGDPTGLPPDTPLSDIRVLVKTNKRALQPPNVRKAQVIIDKASGLRALNISFWTPQTEQEVCENIWRVSLAALDNTGVVPLFSVTRFPNFVRRAFPDAPLPLEFAGELGDAWRYDFTWAFTKEIEANVRRFCTPDGHVEFATSLWFEDVVGHRALAQELIFA
jgi:hypothetical protein